MGWLKSLFYGLRISYFSAGYYFHLWVRSLHDKTYQKSRIYKNYSDKKYTSTIHKAALVAFVASFFFFSIFQFFAPGFFTKPQTVQAGSSSVTWTTTSHFSNNGASNSGYTGATTISNLSTGSDSIKLSSNDVWKVGGISLGGTTRTYHTAVWTGSKMVVWGGNRDTNASAYNTGSIYDPTSDTSIETTTVSAPDARFYHTAIWTGSQMIVWGGKGTDGNDRNTGGIWTPKNGTKPEGGTCSDDGGCWLATATTDAPSSRSFHRAVWTGTQMVVFGGLGGSSALATGAIWTPKNSTKPDGTTCSVNGGCWLATTVTDAPSARYVQSMVWTGSQAVVWGGYVSGGPLATGGIWTPRNGTKPDGTTCGITGGCWLATTATDAPVARSNHTGTWTGSQMIILGGDPSNTGGIWTPKNGTKPDGTTCSVNGGCWLATTTTAAPGARYSHTAVWSGSAVIVWGGYLYSGAATNTGGIWTPKNGTKPDGATCSSDGGCWLATVTTDAPSVRNNHTAIWTNSKMIVFGGNSGISIKSDGGVLGPYYSSSGSISGLKIDRGNAVKSKWTNLSWVLSEALPSNTSVTFTTRGTNVLSPDGNTPIDQVDPNNGWTSFSSLSGISNSSATQYSGNISTVPTSWLEVAIAFTSNGSSTPTINDFTVNYNTLEAPVNTSTNIKKSDDSFLKNSSGNTISAGTAGGWTNETSVKVITTGLSCTSCGTFTNPYIEVETKPVGSAFDGATNITAGSVDGGNQSTATLTGLSAGTGYHIQLRTKDAQGRVSAWTSYGNNAENVADFSIDQTAPTGAVSVNDGADYTTSANVNLVLSGTDSGGSNLSQMRFSNDGNNWSDWEAYNSTKEWSLTGGDGAKNVYAQFVDNAGNLGGEQLEESLAATSDTYAYALQPNTNFGASDDLQVRSDTASTGDSDYRQRSFLRFDLSALSGAQAINSAELSLYARLNTGGGGIGRTHKVYRLSENDWVENEATWNNKDNSTAWLSSGGSYDNSISANSTIASVPSWQDWNLKTLVEADLAEEGDFLDLIIMDSVEAASAEQITYNSRTAINNQPTLLINYVIPYSDSITLDTTPPSNVSNLKAYAAQGGSELTGGNWYPYATPYFEWDQNADSDFDHYAYCFDTSSSCDPTTSLGLSYFWTPNPAITFEGTHYLRVVAVDEAGQSSAVPATFIYRFDATAPGAVTGLSATTTDSAKIRITWNAYGDGASPVDNYKLERVKDSGNEYQISDDWSQETGYASFILSDNSPFDDEPGVTKQGQVPIDASTKYQYRISAKDVSNPAYSAYQVSKIYGMTDDLRAPDNISEVYSAACDGTTALIPNTAIPKCFDVQNKGFEIAITWTPVSDSGSGVAGYNVYRSATGSMGSYSKIATTESLTNFYYDNDDNNDLNSTSRLNDYTRYYYRITAFDGSSHATESDLYPVLVSNATDSATLDATAPTIPTDVVASPLGIDSSGERQKVQITWSASNDVRARSTDLGSGIKSDNGNIVGYKIYRSTELAGPYTDITSDVKLSCDQNTRVCYNEDLDEYPAIYYYKLTVEDNSSNVSDFSTATSVQTASSAVPTAPTGVNVVTKKGNPSTDSEVGDRATITFNGSFAKNCANNLRCLVKYELWRSTTNHAQGADWVNPAKSTKVSEFTPTVKGDDRSSEYTYQDSGLIDATIYYYKVRALDNTPQNPDGGPFYSPLSTIATGTLNAGWDITPDSTKPLIPQSGLEVKVRDTHPSDTEYRNIITWVMISGDNRPSRPKMTYEAACEVVKTVGGVEYCNDFAKYELHREVLDGNNAIISDTKVADVTNINDNYYIDKMDISLGALKYRYYVSIVDNAGSEFKYQNGTVINASHSNITEKQYASDTIIPDQAKPELSGGITLSNVSVSSAQVSWTTDQDADSLVQFRQKNSNDDYVAIGQIERTTSHVVRLFGLRPQTEYEYQIVSRNYLGNNIEYQPNILPALITTGFNITPGNVVTTTSTAEINWSTNLDSASAFVEYQLQRQPGDDAHSGTAGVSAEALSGNAKNHKVILKGLRSNRAYTYKIKSISKDGFLAEYPSGNDQAFETFRTKSFDTGQFILAPSSSNIAERNITSTNAQIIWQTAVPTTTWVEYGTTPGVYEVSAGNNDLTTQHVVVIDGLVPGQKYYYRVRVKDANEVEFISQEYSFRAILKPKISNLKISDVTPYSVTISWDTNIETETLINWGKSSNYGEKRGVVGKSKVHVLKVDNLEDNTEYHYQILARDETGEEVADEDKIVRTPLDTEGPKIEQVKTDILPLGESDEYAQVIISWKTNKPSSRLLQYDEGIIGNGYSKSTIKDESLSTSHTVIIKDLDPAKTYRYRIVAEDKRGNKTISNDYNFITPSKEKSIWQIILKMMEETFSWTKNVGGFFRGIGSKVR